MQTATAAASQTMTGPAAIAVARPRWPAATTPPATSVVIPATAPRPDGLTTTDRARIVEPRLDTRGGVKSADARSSATLPESGGAGAGTTWLRLVQTPGMTRVWIWHPSTERGEPSARSSSTGSSYVPAPEIRPRGPRPLGPR